MKNYNYYRQNKEKYQEYYIQNIDSYKKYYQDNKDRIRQYYQNNKEQIKIKRAKRKRENMLMGLEVREPYFKIKL